MSFALIGLWVAHVSQAARRAPTYALSNSRCEKCAKSCQIGATKDLSASGRLVCIKDIGERTGSRVPTWLSQSASRDCHIARQSNPCNLCVESGTTPIVETNIAKLMFSQGTYKLT